MLFLYDNLVDLATLTGSSAAAGFPANNVKNPFRSKVWRTAGATPGEASLVVDMSALWTPFGFVNLVTNGGFTSNADGWTAISCVLASVAGGDSGNCLRLTSSGGETQAASQAISGLTVGKLYKVTVKVKEGTILNADFGIEASGDGVNYQTYYGNATSSWVEHVLYFTATHTTMTVYLVSGLDSPETIYFDSATCYLMYGCDGIQGIALTGYTWTAAPISLTVQFNNYDVWTSPIASESPTFVSATTPGGNKGSIIKKLSYAYCYRFARLYVNDILGDWDLGRFFLGPVFQPERTYGWGYGEEVVDPSLISASIGGQDHADAIERYRRVTCNGIILTQAQWVLFQKMINAIGTRKPIFAAFDYDNEAAERTIYGRFTKLPSIVRPYLYEYEFEFTEAR